MPLLISHPTFDTEVLRAWLRQAEHQTALTNAWICYLKG